MPWTDLGPVGNIQGYYDLGYDGYYVVNDHDYLAQTITPTSPHDLISVSFILTVDGLPRRFRIELKRTDAFGKPTGPVMDYFEGTTGLTSIEAWAIFNFTFHYWVDLETGVKYALVLSYPDADIFNFLKFAADKSAATYPGGNLLTSSNGGATWTNKPGQCLMFRLWGYSPIPHPIPPPAITNWLLTNLTWTTKKDGFIIIATTDVLCHLWMRHTTVEPQQHKIPRTIRGIALPSDKRFCFVAFTDNEQEEKGDTLIHTFIKTPWPVCETRWFYFYGTRGDILIPSTSAIFSLHFRMLITTIHPNGDGDLHQLLPNVLPHWTRVLEHDSIWIPPNGGGTWGFWSGQFVWKNWWPWGWLADLYTWENPAISPQNIYGIKVYYLLGRDTYPYGIARLILKTHGTTYYGEYKYPGAGFQEFTKQYDTNPFTLLPWTMDELIALQLGISLNKYGSYGNIMCDKIHIDVYYL